MTGNGSGGYGGGFHGSSAFSGGLMGGHESGHHQQQVARLRNKARGQGNASPGPGASLAATTGVQVTNG